MIFVNSVNYWILGEDDIKKKKLLNLAVVTSFKDYRSRLAFGITILCCSVDNSKFAHQNLKKNVQGGRVGWPFYKSQSIPNFPE